MKSTVVFLFITLTGSAIAQNCNFHLGDPLRVSWLANPPMDSVTSYNCYKIGAGGSMTMMDVSGTTAVWYNVIETSSFYVIAKNKDGPSVPSNTVTATLITEPTYKNIFYVDNLPAISGISGTLVPGYRFGLWDGKSFDLPLDIQEAGYYQFKIYAAYKLSQAVLIVNGIRIYLKDKLSYHRPVFELPAGAQTIRFEAEGNLWFFNPAIRIEKYSGDPPEDPGVPPSKPMGIGVGINAE